MAEFVKAYDSDDNSIMPRVIKYVTVSAIRILHTNILNSFSSVYRNGLKNSTLTTIYGCLIGLSKMGRYAIRDCVIPEIRSISEVVEPHLIKDDFDNDLNKASIYIRHRLLKMSAPILKNIHQQPDVLDEYSKNYGFLGCSLYDAVVLDRIMDNIIDEVDDEKILDAIAGMDL